MMSRIEYEIKEKYETKKKKTGKSDGLTKHKDKIDTEREE
jgi:hypothetical protein